MPDPLFEGIILAAHHFEAIDEERFKAFHWRALITTGLGVFCDGYDISCIGIVLPTIAASFGIEITSTDSAALAASALIGSAIGAMVFGFLGQNGRKRFYGLDVLVMGLAALASAFAPNLAWLFVLRFILGVGIGADYVLSPVIMAEHANRADRGRVIGLGFGTMWPLGALVAAVFNMGLEAFDVPPDLVWRIVLGAGAIPALGVLYLRRTMPETARYLARLDKKGEEAAAVIRDITGKEVAAPPPDTRPFGEVFAKHANHIFAAALLWMVYDLVVYAAILFGPNLIAKGLGLRPAEFTILTEIIFVVPASILMSYFLIDQIGRKPLQVWGFFASTLVLIVYAQLRTNFADLPMLAFAVYGLFNVTQTGPGLVSGGGVFGVELAPTRIRSVAQAITVAGGRIGAAISSYVFPIMFGVIGEANSMYVLAGLSLLGAVLTQTLVPETSRVSLEAITEEV
jgi:MFS family permease